MKIRAGQPEWAFVNQHLDQLLDLSDGEVEQYLGHLEHDQPAVAETLREILSARGSVEAESFLVSSLIASPAREDSGTEVGAYVLDSVIGRGGMGEVWQAHRSDGRFEGRFAIKFVDLYAAGPQVLERFRREARLLARLAHPNIARLLDAGASASGRPYLVLEYVQGSRIDEYCDAHDLSIEGRVRLLIDVLAALTHAHSNLIIHRDIKPTNILVTADGQVKLLDFSVAKLLSADSGASEDYQITRLEDVALTPEYAAPEQILGEPPSTATDVYQVGVLMFLLLSGRLPHAGGGMTRAFRVKAALDMDAPRLSDGAPPERRKRLRGDLDAIVGKALRKLPQERYPTAAALAGDLARFLGHEPVSARADLVGYRTRKFLRRYRPAVIGTAAAMLALILSTAFALSQMRQAQRQSDQLREQAHRAEMQAEFISLMMATVGDRPITAEQLVDQGQRLVTEHYTDDPVFRVNAMLNLAARYFELGLTQKQYALLERADAIARTLNDPALSARIDCGLGSAEMDMGQMDRAAAQVAAGRVALARLSNPDPLFVVDCMQADADVADAKGDALTATRVGKRALELLEKAHETHDVRYQDLLGRIADYLKRKGDAHQAFGYVERALAAVQDNGLEDTDLAIVNIHNVASGLLNFGEVKAGCAREKTLIERLTSTQRVAIPAIAVTYGNCLVRQGDPEASLSWYGEGLKTAGDARDPRLEIYARFSRARALVALGRYPEAGADLEAVDALSGEHDLGNTMEMTRARLVRTELLLALGRPADAEVALAPALAQVRDPKSDQRAQLPAALLWSARVALARGQIDEAAALAGECLDEYTRRARDPAASADVGEASLLLARARTALHDAAGSRRAAHQAVLSLTASLGADHPLTRDALSLQ